VPPKHPATLRFLERPGRGNSAENVKQGGIGRDLQIEIEKAVDQYPDAAQQGRNG
jgi:hypothetical protein